ncbi:MAG: hypothetical protein QXD51_01170 [Candidatus Anstonellales archaeon]
MIEIDEAKVLSWFLKPEKISNRIKFSNFRINSNKEVMLFDEKKNTTDNLTQKLGVKGKMFLSHEEEERASVFFFQEGEDACKRIDFFFPKEGGMAMDVADYSLGFKLSKNFSAHAKERSMIVVDTENKKYIFINSRGESYSSDIEIEKNAFCFVMDENRAAIVDRKRLYVIVGGSRGMYYLADVEKENGYALSKPLFGVGEAEGFEWFALSDERWNSACILVSVGDRETLGFMIYEFKNKKFIPGDVK